MSGTEKLRAGRAMPKIRLAKAGGGDVTIGQAAGWQVVVVYRGRHCPICRSYLGGLNRLLDGFQALGAEVIAISADPRDRAENQVLAEGWQFPVGYGLTPQQMRALGLYISQPRSPEETDRLFPEPGLFVVNPEGMLHIVDISNAPFARPDLQSVLNGLKFIQEKQYPIRGTAA